jgi:hypothetical protein
MRDLTLAKSSDILEEDVHLSMNRIAVNQMDSLTSKKFTFVTFKTGSVREAN